jgi:hypothetical protein
MLYGIIILVLGIPVGFLIAWMCRDELVVGRKWFKILTVAGFVIGLFFWFIGERVVAWTCGFVMVVSFVSYVKSFDKKWIKRFP